MNSGAWTPQPDLDIETIVRQERDGTAKVFVVLDGLVVAHLDVIPVPEGDRSNTGYGIEVDAYGYLLGTFDHEVSPTRISVHPFRQQVTTIDEVESEW